MTLGRFRRVAILAIAMFITCGSVFAGIRTRRAPQIIAKKFSMAILRGDFSTAVEFIHPKALSLGQSQFLDALSKAKKSNVVKEYIESLGVNETAKELERLSSKALYVALNCNHYKLKPTSLEFSRQVKIEIVSVEISPSEIAIVRMKNILPSKGIEGIDLTFFTGIELQRFGTEWKIFRDIPELCTQPSAP